MTRYRYYLGWAAVAAAPFVLSALLRPRNASAGEETGFDSFLVKRGEVDTGVVITKKAASKKNKKKKPTVPAGESGPFEVPMEEEDEDDEEEDGRDPAVFSTFLKSSGKGPGVSRTAAAAPPPAAKPVERPSPSMAKVRDHQLHAND